MALCRPYPGPVRARELVDAVVGGAELVTRAEPRVYQHQSDTSLAIDRLQQPGQVLPDLLLVGFAP